MNIDQVYLEIASGNGRRIFHPGKEYWFSLLLSTLTGVLLMVQESWMHEWRNHPKGTIPFLWRLVCGSHERFERFGKHTWVKKGGITYTEKGMSVSGTIQEKELTARFFMRMLSVVLVLSGVPFFFPLTVIASTGTGGDWNNTATWSPAQVPIAGDDVTITSGDTVTVNVNSATGTCAVDGTLALSTNTLEIDGAVFEATSGTISAGSGGELKFVGTTTVTEFRIGNNSHAALDTLTFGDGTNTKEVNWKATNLSGNSRFISLANGTFLVDTNCTLKLDDEGGVGSNSADVIIVDTTINNFTINGFIDIDEVGGTSKPNIGFRTNNPATYTISSFGTNDVNVQFFSQTSTHTVNIDADMIIPGRTLSTNETSITGTWTIAILATRTVTCGDFTIDNTLTGSAATIAWSMVTTTFTCSSFAITVVDGNTHTFTATSGTFNCTGTMTLSQTSGTTTFTSTSATLDIDSTITINGGSFTSSSSASNTMNNIVVAGGTFNGSSGTITGDAGSDITVTSGTLNAGSGTIDYNGAGSVLTVNGGMLNGDTCTVNCEDCVISSGTLDIIDGTVAVNGDLTLSGTGILNGGNIGTGVLKMLGAVATPTLDLSAGTWAPEEGKVECSLGGNGVSITTGGASNNTFFDLVIADDGTATTTTITTVGTIFILDLGVNAGSLVINSSFGTLDLNNTNIVTLDIVNDAISNFDNNGTITGTGVDTVLFRITTNGQKSLGDGVDGIGTLNVPVTIETNIGAGNGGIDLNGVINTSLTDITLVSTAGTNTFDLVGFDVTVNSIVVSDTGEFIQNLSVTPSTLTGTLTLGSSGTMNLPSGATLILANAFIPTGTIDGTGDGTLQCNANLDMSGATYTQDFSTIVMGGASTTLTTGVNSDEFRNLTISNTVSYAGEDGILRGTFINTSTFTLNTNFELRDIAIVNFDNSSGTIAGTSDFIFRITQTAQRILDNSGTIDVDIIMRSSVVSAAGILLGSTFVTTGNLTVDVLDSGLDDMVLDTGVVELSIGGTTTVDADSTLDLGTFTTGDGHNFTGNVTINGILEGGSGEATFDADLNMSSGIFNEGTSFLRFTGGGSIQTQAASQEFFDIIITGATTLSSGDLVRPTTGGSFDNDSTFTINSGSALIFVNDGINSIDNSTGTLQGAGTLRFRIDNGLTTHTLSQWSPTGSTVNVNTEMISTSGTPKITYNGGGEMLIGTGNFTIGVNGGTGMDFDMGASASNELQVGGTTTVESGCELDLALFATGDGHNFTGNVDIDGDLIGGSSIATFAGGLDMLTGTLTPGASTFRFSGGNILTNVNSGFFTNVIIVGTPTLTTGFMNIEAGIFTGTSGTFIVNTTLVMINASIESFNNSAAIIAGSGNLDFQIEDGVDRVLDNIGDIDTSPLTTRLVLGVASASAKITMGADMFPFNLTIISDHASNTMEFDDGFFNIFADGNLTIGTRGILTQHSNIDVVGNWSADATGAVYTNNGKGVFLRGGGTITTNATTEDFFDLNLFSGPTYTLTVGDIVVANLWDNATGTLTVNSGNNLIIQDNTSITGFTNGGTIDGNGTLRIEPSGAGATIDNFGTLDIDVTFSEVSGTPTVTLGANMTTSAASFVLVDTNITIESNNNITWGDMELRGNLATVSDAPGTTAWTILTDCLITSTGTLDVTNIQDTFTLTIGTGANVLSVNGIFKFSGLVSNLVTFDGGLQMNATGFTCQLQYATLTSSMTGGSSFGNVNIVSSLTSTNDNFIRNCTITKSGGDSVGILIQSSVNFEISDCFSDIISGSGTNSNLRFSSAGACLDWTIQRNYFDGARIGVEFSNTDFGGSIRSCVFDATSGSGTKSGLQSTGASAAIPVGSIVNCTFLSPDNSINEAASSGFINLVGCIFDETIGIGQFISWDHNRENGKIIYINSNVSVDSTFYSNIHSDTFDWDGVVAGNWNIEGINKNRFTAKSGTATAFSDFIPVDSSQIYFYKFTGDINAVDILEYDATQTSILATRSFTSGGSGTRTLIAAATTGTTAFVQWSLIPDTTNQFWSEGEIRETSSIGTLVWNEDFLNRYTWSDGVDYDSNQLLFDTTDRQITFGNIAYNRTRFETTIDGFAAATDKAGHVIGYQDSNNFYEVYIETPTTTPTLKVDIVEASIRTNIDSATMVGGSAIPTGDNIILKTHWNEDATGTARAGSFAVQINGVTVTAANWSVSSNNFTDADTTFTTGLLGYLGNGISIDNVTIEHFGFCISGFSGDSTDLILLTGVTITATSSGVVKWENVDMNAPESALIQLGGSVVTLINVTFTEFDFDESVDSVVTVECPPDDLIITTNIVIGVAGQLNLTGVQIKHDSEVPWTIDASQSAVVPPFDFKGVSLIGLKTSFRPIDLSDPVHVIDPKFEFLEQAAKPQKDFNVIRNDVFGLLHEIPFGRNHGDYTMELQFAVEDDECLYGKLEKWKQDERLIEVISPVGGFPFGKVVALEPFNQDPSNPFLHRYSVTIEEWLD